MNISFGSDASARAIWRRCRWPPERMLTPSPISVFIPSGNRSMSWSSAALRAAAQTSSGVRSDEPAMFW